MAQRKRLTGDWDTLFGRGQLNQKARDDKRKQQERFPCRFCQKKLLSETARKSHENAVHPLSLRTQQKRRNVRFW